MTAVLNAIRRLDALLDRGCISPEEYARRRATLLNQIEDAQPDIIDITRVAPPAVPSPDTGRTGSEVRESVTIISLIGCASGAIALQTPSVVRSRLAPAAIVEARWSLRQASAGAASMTAIFSEGALALMASAAERPT